MQKPEAVVTAILNRWASGQLSDEQLSKQLQGCGWTRREVVAYLERARGFQAEREAFAARTPSCPAPASRDFIAERRAALESRQEAAEALEEWRRERLNLEELLGRLQAAGWTSRDVYAYLEREADEQGNRPPSRALRN